MVLILTVIFLNTIINVSLPNRAYVSFNDFPIFENAQFTLNIV